MSDAPVEAHPPSVAYRLRKVARRHRGAFFAASLLAVFLLAGVVATASQAVRATRAEWQARQRLQDVSAAKIKAEKAQQAEMRQREAAVMARREAEQQQVTDADAPQKSLTWLTDLVFGTDHTQLAVATGINNPVQGGVMPGRLILWNVASGETLWEKEQFGEDVAFHPQGTQLATAHGIRTLFPRPGRGTGLSRTHLALLNPSDGEQTLQEFGLWLTSFSIYDIAYSPDGSMIGVLTPDGAQLFDVKEPKLLRSNWLKQRWKSLDVSRRAFAVAISSDQGQYAVARRGIGFGPIRTSEKIELRRINDGGLLKDLASFRLTSGTVTNPLAFDRAGTRVAGEVSGHLLQVWDTATGKTLATLKGHTDRVKHLAFSPDGIHLASGTGKEVRIWELETGTQLAHKVNGLDGTPKFNYSAMTFTHQGDQLVVVDASRVEFCDPVTGNTLDSWPLTHSSSVSDVAISRDARWLATSSWDGTGRIWDIATKKEVHRLTGHRSYVNGIAFSADGRRLVTLGFHTVKLWDVETGQEILSWEIAGGDRAVFNEQNSQLAIMGRAMGVVLDGSYDAQPGAISDD